MGLIHAAALMRPAKRNTRFLTQALDPLLHVFCAGAVALSANHRMQIEWLYGPVGSGGGESVSKSITMEVGVYHLRGQRTFLPRR
jgi:hypothetical protein